MTYLNATKYILSAPMQANDTSAALSKLLAAVGNPQKRLKYIRLTGSNGKSICASMLRCAVCEAGYKAGTLIMPIFGEPKDNIYIGTRCLTMEEFAEYTASVREAALQNELVLTRAELMLAIALIAFRSHGCELCIIESSYGEPLTSGILPPPLAVVLCGAVYPEDTMAVSKFKSYIVRGISEVLTSLHELDASRIISDACYAAGCRLTVTSRQAIGIEKLNLGGCEFTYKDTPYKIGLFGRFEVYNAVLAIEACEMLTRRGFAISKEAVQNGLRKVKLPSKLEVISLSPKIFVDTAHIPHTIETVCSSLSDFSELSGKAVRLCLPSDTLIDCYVSTLKSLGYAVESIYTLESRDVLAEGVIKHKNARTLASALLSGLERDTVLLISGEHAFVDDVRYRLLAKMGF